MDNYDLISSIYDSPDKIYLLHSIEHNLIHEYNYDGKKWLKSFFI